MENLILNKKNKVYIIKENFETVYSSCDEQLNLTELLKENIETVFKTKKSSVFNVKDASCVAKYSVSYFENDLCIIEIEYCDIHALISGLGNVMYLKNAAGKYIYFDQGFIETTSNVTADDIVNKHPSDFIEDKSLVEQIVKNDKQLLEKGKVNFSYFNIESYGVQHVGVIQIPILYSNGKIWGSIGIYVDVATYVKKQEKLRKAAYMDDLTQVYNRHCFNDKLKKYYEDEKFPITLLMGDVDGLKIVNDSLGHLKGDEMIKSIADILKTTCRSSDSVFRWGGDEFLLILPKSTSENAEHLIDRIKKNCDEASKQGVPLSISLGAATIYNKEDNVNKVIEEAEKILYKNKLPKNNLFISNKLSFLNKLVNNLIPDRNGYINAVKKYADILAKSLNMSEKDRDTLLLAVRLNDIGKVGLPEEVVRKRRADDGFTNEDIIKYREHADNGYRIAKSIEEIEIVSEDIFYQFENYNGNGYPKGLKGDQIPLNSRIIRIVNQLYYYYIYEDKTIDEAIDRIDKDNVCDPNLLEKIKENKDKFKKIEIESDKK